VNDTATILIPASAEPESGAAVRLHRFVGRHSSATLYHGDWKDVLPLVADAMITDQPYGTGWIRGGGKKAGEFKRRKETAEWDVFDLAWMEHAPQIVAAFCPIQGVWEMCLRLKTPCVLKYRKSNPAPYGADCEPVVCSRPLAGPWEKEAYNGDNDLHPCQKPVPLMAWLIRELTEEGQTVLDPFMGSGSTGIAAARLHRNFIGIERDAAHYKTACDRIAHELDGALL
jgi:site-specific DNA-methyltransferase (adenine-specific)